MQLHNLQRKTKNKKARQVGRGGTRGKTAGRGTKGQNARAGHKKRPEMRDIIKKIPKQRGRGKNIFNSIQAAYLPMNLGTLSKVVKAGDTITVAYLLEHKLISRQSGKLPKVKVLADGEIAQAVTLVGLKVSATAKAKIEKAGGNVQ